MRPPGSASSAFQHGAEVAGRIAGTVPAPAGRARLPSSRTIAGAAIGSSAHSCTVRPSARRSAAARRRRHHLAQRHHVALVGKTLEGPADERRVGRTRCEPWQALYRRPEPHGQGWRGPTSPSATAWSRALVLERFPMTGRLAVELFDDVRRSVVMTARTPRSRQSLERR